MTISAKIIADSICNGHRITTFELEYPRFIHAEFMTHRLFSRNAASSRAIPVKKAIELIREDTAMPIHWGKNQPGMSAKEECNDLIVIPGERDPSHDVSYTREQWWNDARNDAINHAYHFDQAGYHKQIVNRMLEPFSHIKVVCTATEYDNFFYLRCHKAAQPEIQHLAELMYAEYTKSKPVELKPGEWHVPYYRNGYWTPSNDDESLEDALAISSSCCAQVSYRKLDDSLEKAKDIYKRLVDSKPVHASPFEHQATPINLDKYYDGFVHDELEKGITAIDLRDDNSFWSGNFRNWIQHRQLINDNVCNEYKP